MRVRTVLLLQYVFCQFVMLNFVTDPMLIVRFRCHDSMPIPILCTLYYCYDTSQIGPLGSTSLGVGHGIFMLT